MILDGIVIIFIIFSAYSGFKKGLSTILMSLIGFVVAIILAFMFKASLAEFVINNTEVDTFMSQTIHTGIDKAIESKASSGQSNPFYEGLIKNIGVDQTVDTVANNVTNFIIQTAAFILIFLAVKTCAFILEMMLNVVFDLPILSSINNIGGFGAGAIMSLFKIWIILAIISVLLPMFGGLKSLIDSTTITKMLYDTNIITNLLSSGLKF